MPTKAPRSCLLITYGPVPTTQYQTVEGGGMRVWGLAKGLKANGIDVVVGVNQSFPQKLEEHEGIRLINWELNDQFASLINTYDAVVMSYCMGDPSIFVVNNLSDNVQLILDAYVPIYVEVSARDSKDTDTEYTNYMADIAHFNKVLKRGDYFLCANEAQKTFYTGVLSSLGIVNPRSYREKRLLVVPFGIHDTPTKASENPYLKLSITEKDFVVLWFGGLYPWFHVEELLAAMLSLSKNKLIKFVFVGGKNPFNDNPDLRKQYEKTVSFADEHSLTNTSVFFADWVDFDERINWYKHADIVISLNQPGEENKYSWRTRVMDYVWGELAILTNGGDPLSEDLIAADAAIRLPKLSSAAIVKAVETIYNHQGSLVGVKKNVRALKPAYYWDSVTKPVEAAIAQGLLPYAAETSYKKKLGITSQEDTDTATPASANKLRQAWNVTPRVVAKVRTKGMLRSAKIATRIVGTQVKKRTVNNRRRQYVFISHPLDNTGAPVVLLQIIKEFALKYGGSNVKVVTPGAEDAQLRILRELGVAVETAVFGIGFRFIRLQLGLRKNDFVLMNTVAIYDNYRDFVMFWLKSGRLKHAYWFIHEDRAQLPVLRKDFLDKKNIAQVHTLLKKHELDVLVPSERTKKEYNELLDTTLVRTINLHVEVDKKYYFTRKASDYKRIDFLLQGTPSDGRKGHLIAITAFNEFLKTYYLKNPENYRDFALHFVSIGNDYVSQQVRSIGNSLLGSRLRLYSSMPKTKVLDIYAKCNAVICCSLNETFGLYVAESMFMGAIVLRNNSAGVDEQLQEGKNGYFIDHTNIRQFTKVIEKVLNRKTSPDTKLLAMGQASQKIIEIYGKNNYLEQLENLS